MRLRKTRQRGSSRALWHCFPGEDRCVENIERERQAKFAERGEENRRHAWADAGGGTAGFQLGPFLPTTTSTKPCPVCASRRTPIRNAQHRGI
jgi:hypothetical protein